MKGDSHAKLQVFEFACPRLLGKVSTKCSDDKQRVLRSTETDVKIPLLKTINVQKAFPYRSAKLWNCLERVEKLVSSRKTFKEQLWMGKSFISLLFYHLNVLISCLFSALEYFAVFVNILEYFWMPVETIVVPKLLEKSHPGGVRYFTIRLYRNLRQFWMVFETKIKIRELEIFPGSVPENCLPPPPFIEMFQWSFLRICTIGSSKQSGSFLAMIFVLIELCKKSTTGQICCPFSQNRFKVQFWDWDAILLFRLMKNVPLL